MNYNFYLIKKKKNSYLLDDTLQRLVATCNTASSGAIFTLWITNDLLLQINSYYIHSDIFHSITNIFITKRELKDTREQKKREREKRFNDK